MFSDYFDEHFFDLEYKSYLCIDMRNRIEFKDLNIIRRNIEEIKNTINNIQDCDYVKTNIQIYPFSFSTKTCFSISIKISNIIRLEFKQYLLKLIKKETEYIRYERYNNGIIDIEYDKEQIKKLLNSF